MLWWMRRIIGLRKQHPAFGRGTIEFLTPDNSKVLAYLRQHEDETLLVVANLSRYAQCAELDLSRFRGQTPVELFGQTRVPGDRRIAVLSHARSVCDSTGFAWSGAAKKPSRWTSNCQRARFQDVGTRCSTTGRGPVWKRRCRRF